AAYFGFREGPRSTKAEIQTETRPVAALFSWDARRRRQRTRTRLAAIVHAAPSLMQVLRTVRGLGLPDWLVMSGAVYQPVLNHATGRAADYGVRDYDLGYFDPADISYEAEDIVIRRVAAAFDEPLKSAVEVRNQARVHLWFGAHFGEAYTPLSSTAEALERFVSPMFAVG